MSIFLRQNTFIVGVIIILEIGSHEKRDCGKREVTEDSFFK